MSKGLGIWVSVAVVAAAAVAVMMVFYFRASETVPVGWDHATLSPERWTRPVVLFFGDPDTPALKAETREVLEERTLADNVTRVIGELARGPANDGVALLSTGCRVRAVFEEPDGGVVIDFAGSPLPKDVGELSSELALQSILQVIAERFPDIARVTLLVDGEPLADAESRLAIPRTVELARVRRPDVG